MLFGVMGPLAVQARDDAPDTPVTSDRQRTLLAALMLRAGQVVSVDALAETIWEGAPPEGAIGTVRAYVMRLRKRLGPEARERIVTHSPGYVLRAEPDEIDVTRFERLNAAAVAAARAGEWRTAREAADGALRLWRDTPLIDVPSQQLKDAWLPRLGWLRLQSLECRIRADLQLGEDESLVAELRELVHEYPLSEPLHASLILALDRSGRGAEAIEAYESARGILAAELGAQPGTELAEIHRGILARQAPRPAPRAEPVSAKPTAPRGPRQLPADTRAFVGREDELGQLLDVAHAALAGSTPGTAVITAIDGLGGIGKTALALRAAHLLRERFPDGQLYLNLRGHAPGAQPLTPKDALAALLHSLGVGPQRMPADEDERANLYRHLLADSRTLIMLDDATGSEQVRKLLPGASGCVVLITGRSRFAGLDEAHAVTLGALRPAESGRLLAAIAGLDRVAEDDPNVAALLDWCAHFPLAVRIVGARLRNNPSLRVEELLDELADERRRLHSLSDGERDFAAVLSTSYTALPPTEQRLLRLMAVAPAVDFDDYAAACLLGANRKEAERLLGALAERSLLIQRTASRHQFHDLVRLFAREEADREARIGCESDEQRAAVERLLDYYEQGSADADALLSPLRHTSRGSSSPVEPAVLADQLGATAWFHAERENLMASIHWANRGGGARPKRGFALYANLAEHLLLSGLWHDWLELGLAAQVRAEAAGERQWQAAALEQVSEARRCFGRYQEAIELAEQASRLYRELGDPIGESIATLRQASNIYSVGDFERSEPLHRRATETLGALGCALPAAIGLWSLGRYRYARGDSAGAIADFGQAMEVFELHDHVRSVATVLCDVSRAHMFLRDFEPAASALQRALKIYRELDVVKGYANALWNLGRVQHAAGEPSAAISTLSDALETYQQLGDRNGTAYSYLDLGRIHHAIGEHARAVERLSQARAAFRSMGHPNGAANASVGLGKAYADLAEPDKAAELYEEAMAYFREADDQISQASTLCALADLAGMRQDPDTAVRLAEQALEIARRLGSPTDEDVALKAVERWSDGRA